MLFYSKLWTFRGKKKNNKKKCTSFLHEPCVLPASPSCPALPPTSPQLTETWQWPICMCWQPQLMLLFFWSHLLGLGKVLPATSCHPWKPFGIQCWPVPLEQGLFGTGCKCSVPSGPLTCSSNFISGVAMVPRAGQVTFFFSNCKSNQSSAVWLDPFSPLSKHTCRLATVAFCNCLVLKEQVYVFVICCAWLALSVLLEHRLLFLD